jgi:hypothetical protein
MNRITVYNNVESLASDDIETGDLVKITDDELASKFESADSEKDPHDAKFEYHRYGYVTDIHEEDFEWYDVEEDERITVTVPDDSTVYIVAMLPINAGAHPIIGSSIEPADEDIMSGFNKNADVEDATEEMSEHDVDSVYEEWDAAVNMTASELREWSSNPCSREASIKPEKVIERNLSLLETDKSDWGQDEVEDAKRTISFIARMRGQKPDDPRDGVHGCPSPWAISLLNWAYNPFDTLPNVPDDDDLPEVEQLEESVSDVPRVTRNQMGLQPWPESWRESNKPARLIAMDAWTSMGATFRGCRRSMVGSIRNPNRFCAAFKDAIYGHTYWRDGG